MSTPEKSVNTLDDETLILRYEEASANLTLYDLGEELGREKFKYIAGLVKKKNEEAKKKNEEIKKKLEEEIKKNEETTKKLEEEKKKNEEMSDKLEEVSDKLEEEVKKNEEMSDKLEQVAKNASKFLDKFQGLTLIENNENLLLGFILSIPYTSFFFLSILHSQEAFFRALRASLIPHH